VVERPDDETKLQVLAEELSVAKEALERHIGKRQRRDSHSRRTLPAFALKSIVRNKKRSAPLASSLNTPLADTMMAAPATSSTAVPAINTHRTAADITIVIPPVENGQSRAPVF